MRAIRRIGTGTALVLVICACSVPAPGDRPAPVDSATAVGSPSPITNVAPEAGGLDPSGSPTIAEPGDPSAALAGRAVAGLGAPGIDVVFRIDAEGFQLPEDEFILDIHGDRVLSARRVLRGENTRLVVRDLDSQTIREIDPAMQVTQTAIVRGDDVFFAGIDVTYDEQGSLDSLIDRGVWVARGDAPAESIYAPELPVVYSRLASSSISS